MSTRSGPKVFVALSTFATCGADPLRLLEASELPFVVNPHGRRLTRAELVELGHDCHGVVAGVEPYDREVIDGMPELRCISRAGVGIDNIDLVAAAERGINVRNTPDVVVEPVAEYAVAAIFDLLKRLTAQTERLKAGRWEKLTGGMLCARRVGVLGLGRIGRRVAEMLGGLASEVWGCDPRPDLDWARRAGVSVVPAERLLAECDVVTLHLAHHPEHPFRLGADELATMRPGALLVNAARGAFVDDEALCAALAEGRLAGAALDVFAEEPYSGCLTAMDNVVLTPHVATLTRESRLRMEVQAVQNVLECLAGGAG